MSDSGLVLRPVAFLRKSLGEGLVSLIKICAPFFIRVGKISFARLLSIMKVNELNTS